MPPIVFASSTFALSDLLAQGSWGDTYALTHDGSAVTFIVTCQYADLPIQNIVTM